MVLVQQRVSYAALLGLELFLAMHEHEPPSSLGVLPVSFSEK